MSGRNEKEKVAYTPGSRGADMLLVAENIQGIDIPSHGQEKRDASRRLPERDVQQAIIQTALGEREDLQQDLLQTFDDPFGQGLSRQTLLEEYTSVMLAREFAYKEKQLHRSGKLDFFVHTAGMELAQIALQRHMTLDDAYLPYYRGQAADIHRGGAVEDLLAQDLHRTGDSHSLSRQLGGHVSSAERSTISAISITGAHFLTAVGIGNTLNDRRERDNASSMDRFADPDAIAVAETGEATFAQGEVMEAVTQAVKDSSATVFVCYDNNAGISMGHDDTMMAANDPIHFARAFADDGLNIVEVSGTDLDALMEAGKNVVSYTRDERKPSLLLVRDLHRVTDHTSSSHQPWFTTPDELARREKLDFLTSYKERLVTMGVATDEELQAIDAHVANHIDTAANTVLARPAEDPAKLYEHVYSPNRKYGPLILSENPAVPPVDHLESSRTDGVEYTDKKRSGIEVTGRQYVNIVLAQEMARDPRIVVYGEDVAMATKKDWHNMPDYLQQRIKQKKDGLKPEQIAHAQEVVELVRAGKGHLASPEALAAFADIMDGKGGVFRMTQFLDFLFGEGRAFNFPIREASIVGTGIGRAIAGELPIVEVQFDAYTSPAHQQIHDYLSTLRWRGGGHFNAGMVIRMQGMNRVGGDGITKAGGVGGIGHGSADISKFLIPGLRHFIPGDVEDLGAGLREAIRVAREDGDPVMVWEPINLFAAKGVYQGPNAHIPLGEAEIRRRGSDMTMISWSNNVRIADAVAVQLEKEGYDVGVINARALGDQFDWHTVDPEIKRTGKIMTFEAGRKDGGALAAQIQQQYFSSLDAPVIWIPARNIPMPAGEENERFVVPQFADILERARALAAY